MYYRGTWFEVIRYYVAVHSIPSCVLTYAATLTLLHTTDYPIKKETKTTLNGHNIFSVEGIKISNNSLYRPFRWCHGTAAFIPRPGSVHKNLQDVLFNIKTKEIIFKKKHILFLSWIFTIVDNN